MLKLIRRLLATTALTLVVSSSTNAQMSLSGVSDNADTIGYPFTPLHLFYISPTGSDGASGTSPGTAWATPNHAVNCGDVIIAAAGSYGTSWGAWGTVSNCPSTTGGIDGTGGIYFATVLCAGPDIVSCKGTSTSTTQFDINKSNWAVEGFESLPSGKTRSFEAINSGSAGSAIHHIAFVNDVAINSLQAADTNDGGQANAKSADYFAVVGMIAQNAAQDGICLAAIDVVGPGQFDSNAGTHFYVYGNFSYSHTNASCISQFDTEDYMFDSWTAHNITGQGVIANNIGFNAERNCIQLTQQSTGTSSPVMRVYNNTCYDNNRTNGTDSGDGEFNTGSSQAGSNMTYQMSVWNNVLYQPNATGTAGNALWGYLFGGHSTTGGGSIAVGSAVGVGDENVIKGSFAGSCPSTCNTGGKDALSFAGSGAIGGNFYTNPNYNNLTDLANNQLGAPTCTGFATTTSCMGYNVLTSTLTTNTIISDLQATCGSCGGKGYQLPSISCAPNVDYPTWLKGIVRLQWNSANSTITEMPDLVTKPCGI